MSTWLRPALDALTWSVFFAGYFVLVFVVSFAASNNLCGIDNCPPNPLPTIVWGVGVALFFGFLWLIRPRRERSSV